ncbi:MAG: hypothetical protein LW823_03315 [Rickettsiales bacterium]|jgi:hypothetical protein|nr:hypothetical protein [Rickettsiales bacterium]
MKKQIIIAITAALFSQVAISAASAATYSKRCDRVAANLPQSGVGICSCKGAGVLPGGTNPLNGTLDVYSGNLSSAITSKIPATPVTRQACLAAIQRAFDNSCTASTWETNHEGLGWRCHPQNLGFPAKGTPYVSCIWKPSAEDLNAICRPATQISAPLPGVISLF